MRFSIQVNTLIFATFPWYTLDIFNTLSGYFTKLQYDM